MTYIYVSFGLPHIFHDLRFYIQNISGIDKNSQNNSEIPTEAGRGLGGGGGKFTLITWINVCVWRTYHI